MRPSEGLTRRLFKAHKHLEVTRNHKVGQAELGRLVAATVGRKEYDQGTVSDWFKLGVRDVDVLWPFAKVCGVSFLWLAVNEGPMVVPAVVMTDAGPRPLDEGEEVSAAERDRLREAEKARGARGPGRPQRPRRRAGGA